MKRSDNGINTDTAAKPFTHYPGGKEGDGVYQSIINQIPPHDVFISGFCGNCAITRKKRPSASTYLIDIDPKVIGNWKKWKEESGSHYEYLHFLNGNFINLMKDIGPLRKIIHENSCVYKTFIYLDPPYPFNVRKSLNDLYEYELTDVQHYQLLQQIKRLSKSIMVAISSYPNELYNKELKDWRFIDYPGRTRHGIVTERLYMNYPEPKELHDYSYIGKDFRERLDIKRQRKRIINKIKGLPLLERMAVIKTILEEIGP